MDFYDFNYMEHLQGHTRIRLESIRNINQERSGKDVAHEEFSLEQRLLPENCFAQDFDILLDTIKQSKTFASDIHSQFLNKPKVEILNKSKKLLSDLPNQISGYQTCATQ